MFEPFNETGVTALSGSLPQREREQGVAGGDRHVLLAVDRVAHRAAVDLAAERAFQSSCAGAGVQREEVTFLAAAEERDPTPW